jgi:ubiquitin-protein ligase
MWYFPYSMYEGVGLVRGSPGTEYHGGYYLIHFNIPETYPFDPPKCCHISFSDRRQSPNFHDPTGREPGKVCLSRLNTWDKERWLPSMNILSVLTIIKTQVLISNPLDNEPVHTDPADAENYRMFTKYQNFRSNVVDIYRMMAGPPEGPPGGPTPGLPDDIRGYIADIIKGVV